MLINALFAFLHFAAAFGLVATLVFEWLSFSRTPSLIEARRIALADRWYGISAGVVLVVGFLRAVYFEKGMGYYASNPFFHAKIALFVLIGLLSIYPTLRFFRWGAELKAGRAPVVSEPQFRIIANSLKAQMLLLVALLLCASLMAHGVGA
jgi:putative membrane protein